MNGLRIGAVGYISVLRLRTCSPENDSTAKQPPPCYSPRTTINKIFCAAPSTLFPAQLIVLVEAIKDGKPNGLKAERDIITYDGDEYTDEVKKMLYGTDR